MDITVIIVITNLDEINNAGGYAKRYHGPFNRTKRISIHLVELETFETVSRSKHPPPIIMCSYNRLDFIDFRGVLF